MFIDITVQQREEDPHHLHKVAKTQVEMSTESTKGLLLEVN